MATKQILRSAQRLSRLKILSNAKKIWDFFRIFEGFSEYLNFIIRLWRGILLFKHFHVKKLCNSLKVGGLPQVCVLKVKWSSWKFFNLLLCKVLSRHINNVKYSVPAGWKNWLRNSIKSLASFWSKSRLWNKKESLPYCRTFYMQCNLFKLLWTLFQYKQ